MKKQRCPCCAGNAMVLDSEGDAAMCPECLGGTAVPASADDVKQKTEQVAA
jgi:hypothetical protein